MVNYVLRPLDRSYQERDDTLKIKITVAHPTGEVFSDEISVSNLWIEFTGGVTLTLRTSDGTLSRTDESNRIILEGSLIPSPLVKPLNPSRVHYRVRSQLTDGSRHTIGTGVFNLS